MNDEIYGKLVKHTCRYCGCRIMKTSYGYICTSCEAMHRGDDVEGLCNCGVVFNNKKPFECRLNPDITVQTPFKYIMAMRI